MLGCPRMQFFIKVCPKKLQLCELFLLFFLFVFFYIYFRPSLKIRAKGGARGGRKIAGISYPKDCNV